MPITASASTSCDTDIEPIRAASDEPERPATRIAIAIEDGSTASTTNHAQRRSVACCARSHTLRAARISSSLAPLRALSRCADAAFRAASA